MGGTLAAMVPVYRFLDDLFDLRIVMPPSFLTSIAQDNVTLEFRRGAPAMMLASSPSSVTPRPARSAAAPS